MKKILGLDLGTNSIGWALIEVDNDENPIRIIAMGSRIIPLASNERDQFQKGQAISKNQERTTARTQRKGYDRKQLKKNDDFKYSLKKALEKYSIYPSKDLFNLPMLDLWKLRSDAANKPIEAEQLGRILYMLNQKRGYKSARSEANADKKDTDYVQAVKGRYAQLKEQKQTIGQFFYDGLKHAKDHNQYFRVKEEVYPREAYIEEFDTIINIQKVHHQFLTDELIHSLRDEIIYYQRKLKSQKGLVNVCELEGVERTITDTETSKEKTVFTGPKVAAKSSPIFQLSRIWETVNNVSLKIKNPEGSKYKWGDRFPTQEEKQAIADYLWKSENLSFAELIKIMNLKKEEVYSNKQILRGIPGNKTYAELAKIISDEALLQFNVEIIPTHKTAYVYDRKTGEILSEIEGWIVNGNIEHEPLYQLWHTIYSIKELDECKKALIKRFHFNEETADKLSRIDFDKQGYSNKSARAIRKILPYLMKGYNLTEAESLAGFASRSLTKEQLAETGKDEKLILLPKNSLRQPVVEKILNQMINVVNAIIDKHGKPTEIRIELARELKQSKDEREDADKQNNFNKKVNEEVAGRLKELGLPTTKRFIEKYKFIFPVRDKNWKEAQVVNQCIYCGEHFSLSEALSGDSFDVDHIVPKALLFDDSQTNKVLVHRKCNSHKTNQTAYDYIDGKGDSVLQDYLDRVDTWFKRGIISYSKMNRLKVSHKQYLERKKAKKETEADKKLWENFIDRQLRETQYITRKSRDILSKICNSVKLTEGNVTAKLRQLWGWDDVLMNLQLPKYKEIGQTVIKEWTSDHGKRTHQKEEIANWTKRDDHRHHAIDALVIACTQQGFIQRINTLNADKTKDEMQQEIDKAKREYGDSYNEEVLNEVNEKVKFHRERLSKLDLYLGSQRPKIFTSKYVAEEADKILISFKPGKKVATISKFKAVGKNEETGVITPRGALHEAGLYGRIELYRKGGITEQHVIKKYKVGVSAQDHIFNGKETYSLKKDKIGNEKIEDKVKIVLDSIVDSKVRDVILERLNRGFEKGKDYKSDVKTALNNFKNIETDPVWYNEEKGIKILSIKLKTGLKDSVVPIRSNANGKVITLVKTGNNHHIAIYKDDSNKPVQHACTFWHAVERKKHQIPYIIKNTKELWSTILDKNLPQSFIEKLPADNLELQYSLQQNEMFVLGLKQEEFDLAIQNDNKPLISKHLYLVWSIGENQYWFRHHLETKNSELKQTIGARESRRFHLFKSMGAFLDKNPIKLKINHLGEVVTIGERWGKA